MPLETRPVDGSFAREVIGLRLWEQQDDQTIDELRALWAHHPVLVFRRQALSEDELADFSAFFGSLEWFREIPDQITARRKGHTSPTYRGAVRLHNNREDSDDDKA